MCGQRCMSIRRAHEYGGIVMHNAQQHLGHRVLFLAHQHTRTSHMLHCGCLCTMARSELARCRHVWNSPIHIMICRIVQLHMIVGISCSASATPASQSNAAPATTASQSNAISMIDACSRNRMHGGQCIAVEIECNIGNIRVAVAYTIGNQSLLSSAPSQST